MNSARNPGPRYAALLRLLRTADRIWNASRVFFGRWELSPSQFNILNLICDTAEGMTQTALSRELLMHRSNVTGLVDRLEIRGLVERRELAGDRRVYRVVLTAVGRRLMSEILPRYYEAAEEVWGEMSTEDAGRLSDELQRIADQAEQVEARYRGRGMDRRRRGRVSE
ncbi:MAG: MarR family transcriptional regulator [Verrucomicrobia bacterium]|nr:MarR family transcriptional regulator [Verrucomicrobiota bacterium]